MRRLNQHFLHDHPLLNYNLTQSGLLKVFITDDSGITDVIPVEIKQALISITHNIPSIADKEKISIEISAKNNIGESIKLDKLIVRISDPDNKKETIEPEERDIGEYSFDFEYMKSGNYIFDIIPQKDGYISLEYTAITAIKKNLKSPGKT